MNEEQDYVEMVRTPDQTNEIEDERITDERSSKVWDIFGTTFPRSEIVFLCQMMLIYTITRVALINLSRGIDPSNLWVALLSSCLGYVLPNPTITSK